MRAAATPDHVVARRWQQWREERYESARQKHDNRRVKGLDLVLRLDDGRKIEFRGRHYGVPPVPWDVSGQVLAAQQWWSDLEKDAASPQWPSLYREVARLFKLICFPVSRVRRLLWPLTPSPLLKATHLEVARALGFFSTFRRLDRGESPSAILEELLHPETSRTNSAGSRRTSPTGSMLEAVP